MHRCFPRPGIAASLRNLTGTPGVMNWWKPYTMPTVIKLAVEDQTMRIEAISVFTELTAQSLL